MKKLHELQKERMQIRGEIRTLWPQEYSDVLRLNRLQRRLRELDQEILALKQSTGEG